MHGDECVGVGGVSSASCTRGQRACGRQHPAWGGRRLGLPAEPGWWWVAGGDTACHSQAKRVDVCAWGTPNIVSPPALAMAGGVSGLALTHYHAGNGKIGVKTTNSTASCFLSRAAHFGTHPLALVDVLKKNKNARDEYLSVGGK